MHNLPPAEMHELGIIVDFGEDIAGNLQIMNFLFPYTKRLMLRERGVTSVVRNTAVKFML